MAIHNIPARKSGQNSSQKLTKKREIVIVEDAAAESCEIGVGSQKLAEAKGKTIMGKTILI